MELGLLYENSLTDVAPHGPERVFVGVKMSWLLEVMELLKRSPVA